MEFTKQNESVNETFVAENENYKYTGEVSRQDGKVVKVAMNVYNKTKNGEEHLGFLTLEKGYKSTGFPEDTDIIPHVAVFEEFVNGLEE